MILISLFLHAFHTFRPRFWVFEKILGFFKIDEIFVKFLGWVLLKWSYMLMHCITFAFLTMFHAIWCVFVVTLCWWVWIGLNRWWYSCYTSHDHAFFMHTYHSFLFLVYLLIGAFQLLSLSLSLIVCAWHLSANPLCPKTLFVPGHHLLLTLLHYMLGSVIWRLVRTSWRTSPNVAFIRNSTISYWTSQILIYWLSFTGGDGSLFVRS